MGLARLEEVSRGRVDEAVGYLVKSGRARGEAC